MPTVDETTTKNFIMVISPPNSTNININNLTDITKTMENDLPSSITNIAITTKKLQHEPTTKSHIDPVDQCRARGKGIFEALVRRRLGSKRNNNQAAERANKLYAEREEDVEVLTLIKLNHLRMQADVMHLMIDLNKVIGLLIGLLNGQEAVLDAHVQISDNYIESYTTLPDPLTQLLYNKEDESMLRLPVTLFWRHRPNRKHLRTLLEFAKQNAEACFQKCLPAHCELIEIITKRRGANLDLIFQPFAASNNNATSSSNSLDVNDTKQLPYHQALWCVELKSTYEHATLDLASMMTTHNKPDNIIESRKVRDRGGKKTAAVADDDDEDKHNDDIIEQKQQPNAGQLPSSNVAGGAGGAGAAADDTELKLSRYFLRNLEDAQGMQWLCQQFANGSRHLLPAMRCIWYVFNFKRRQYFSYINFESDMTPWRFVVLLHYLFLHRFRATSITDAILNTFYVLSGGLLLREHFKLPDPISCESPYNRDIFADMDSEERKEICHYAEKMLQYIAEQRLEKIFNVDVAEIQQEFARRAEVAASAAAAAAEVTDDNKEMVETTNEAVATNKRRQKENDAAGSEEDDCTATRTTIEL